MVTAELDSKGRKYVAFAKLIDKVSFGRIFSMWIAVVFLFGIVYHTVSVDTHNSNYLASLDGNRITGFVDAVYYSFVTATSTGYGDITPKGKALRSIAIIEVIFSLLMIALVTSKLVSLKQDKLLEQIYSLSFSEKMSKLVNGFTFFSGEIDTALAAIKNNTFDRKARFDLKNSINSMKRNMTELKKELFENEYILKNTDPAEMEYILHGMSQAFFGMNEIISEAGEKKVNVKGSLIEGFYLTTNIGTDLLSNIKKEFPLYTSKAVEIENTIKGMKPKIMEYLVAEHEKEPELVNPEITYTSA